ncbi:hypothetical protein SDC9_206724 [bioreactor metagenome]|uniref:Uncharacterized protein n=1 Tax=bioreactor metagenome TaxID=1076179 RepID=A0A645J6I8_9ZZZZ
MVPALLKIQPVCSRSWMCQQDIDISGVPVVGVSRAGVLPNAQTLAVQRFFYPWYVVAEAVKHQRVRPAKGLHRFAQHLQLAVVDFRDSARRIIHRAVAQLQQLILQCCRAAGVDSLLVHFQQHFALQPVVGRLCLFVQRHRRGHPHTVR